MMFANEDLAWRRSSRCESGSCVAVAVTADQVFVRQAAVPDGAWLTFSRPSWATFVEGVRAGDFDRPSAS